MSEKIVRALTRSPLHIVIILICIAWMLPSMGLLISSFRPAVDVTSTGWWSVFQTPFKFTQFTLENYVKLNGRKSILTGQSGRFLEKK